MKSGSIRKKLFMIVVMLLMVAMLLVFIANASITVRNRLEEAKGSLQLLADVTSHNLEGSLLFQDAAGAQEVIDNLIAIPNIQRAEVRDDKQRIIASLDNSDDVKQLSRAAMHNPIPESIEVIRPVRIGQKTLGTLMVKTSLSDMWEVLCIQLAQMAIIMAIVLLIAVILIRRLSMAIVAPISEVADIAHRISEGGDYALRVPEGNVDELGDMSAALNRMLAEIEQRDQALRIAAVAFESQEGMFVTDEKGNILRTNRSFTDITGYSSEEAAGQNPRILQSGLQENAFYEAMWEKLRKSGAWQGEIWNRRKDGTLYPEWLTITAVSTRSGEVTNYVATLTDITERKAAEKEISQLAFFDPLTHLPNRRLLMDRLSQRLLASHRKRHSGALMFIDLDNFKQINDTLGHDVGDLLLQQVSQRITHCVREADTVARLGGDEFVVLLDNLSEAEHDSVFQAETVGTKILGVLSQPYRLGEHEYRCTPSIGVALFGDDLVTMDDLMKRADIAMYQAKKAGRNALRFFDPEMQAAVESRTMLERDLDRALAHEQMVIHLQSQIDHAGHVKGAELLLRWQHPSLGLISPAEFISLAEETGHIVPIGAWVLEQACLLLQRWATMPALQHLRLAVNVSARQFRQPDFVGQVMAVLKRSGVDSSRLKLELTESMVMENMADTIAKMHALRKLGVVFSMDDFGTGYSSLSNLKKLPLDQLKIDKSFVRDIPHHEEDAVIVQTIIAMAHSLGMEVLAEGVETEDQRHFLFENQCHHYQGFLFGKPMTVECFELEQLGQNNAGTLLYDRFSREDGLGLAAHARDGIEYNFPL